MVICGSRTPRRFCEAIENLGRVTLCIGVWTVHAVAFGSTTTNGWATYNDDARDKNAYPVTKVETCAICYSFEFQNGLRTYMWAKSWREPPVSGLQQRRMLAWILNRGFERQRRQIRAQYRLPWQSWSQPVGAGRSAVRFYVQDYSMWVDDCHCNENDVCSKALRFDELLL